MYAINRSSIFFLLSIQIPLCDMVQSKGNKSRYVIKVMKVISDKGRGTFLRVRENQKMYQAFSLDDILY
jgi:hypothetical protein